MKVTGRYILISSILFLFFRSEAGAQVLSSKQIDSLVEQTLKAFEVPGIAVAVIKDGQVIHSKGYGVRSLTNKQPVDENTMFAIASNTKAFTVAAVAILIDEQKITWDTKVTKVLPEFKMYNDYVTEEFTIRDLLTHRSGLGLGAGDLMFWPDSSTVSKSQVIHNLRYLKPVSGFRSKFDYDNLLYIVAGEVIARVSGMTWEEFIESRIMKPLGMGNSAASFKRLKDKSDVIDAHAPIEGKIAVIPRDFAESSNAAGGINTNIAELSKWVIMQLNDGKYGDNFQNTLFNKEDHNEMWTLQTVIPGADPTYNGHFFGYGLGWFLSDEKGYFRAEHTGGLAGMVSEVTLLPELKLGIIVLTNQQQGAAFTAITNAIKDGYYGIKGVDRIKENADIVKEELAYGKKVTENVWASIDAQQKLNKDIKRNLDMYTGTFTDQWFGNIYITLKQGNLYFQAKNSPKLQGRMQFYKENTFIVKWNDRSLDADAFVTFALGPDSKASGIKMKAISPLTDFSFDFHDLDLKRINNASAGQ